MHRPWAELRSKAVTLACPKQKAEAEAEYAGLLTPAAAGRDRYRCHSPSRCSHSPLSLRILETRGFEE